MGGTPAQTWAVEGASGVGRMLAQQLVGPGKSPGRAAQSGCPSAAACRQHQQERPRRRPVGRDRSAALSCPAGSRRRGLLAAVRHWDVETIDPATGLAVSADYPDGTPVLFRFWSPPNGAEQPVVVGVK